MRRKVGSVVLVAALVVLAGIAVPGAVGGAPAAPPGGDATPATAPAVGTQADDGEGNATNGTGTTNGVVANDTDNASLGTQVSSFMAASSADAENEVRTGMFQAKWNRSNASRRERLVGQRTEEIAERIAELREEREELLSAENLTARERAQATWLDTQADGLARSIGLMTEAANRTNVTVDRDAISGLRRSARNLSGGEVAEMEPGFVDRGPPGDAGPPDDAGPPGDGGPPEEPGNGTDADPPEDPEEDGNGTDSGPSDDPDGGEGAGEPGGPGNDDSPGGDDSGDGSSGGEDGGSGNGNGSGGSGNSGGGEGEGSGSGSSEGEGSGSGSGQGEGSGFWPGRRERLRFWPGRRERLGERFRALFG
ncbi:hypothetical protein BRC93_13155 [Halobacteriales archaeon QS_5_70_15]|nr:MAG: hypothetical protein BRC93_13155 [Halobacteriales archaeon QS_5_70_15]